MMRRLILVGLGLTTLAVILGAILLARQGQPKSGVAVIGDDTPQLLEALDLNQALPLHTAALTVVSVQTWDKLPFVADMNTLCAGHCADPFGIVRLLRLRPDGSDRLLFVNHDAIGEGSDIACVAQVIRAEIAEGLDTLPPCAKGTEVKSLWSVPGFGVF